MPATLRKPDVAEIPPLDGSSRAERLEKFITQRLAQNIELVSLLAWRTDSETWAAWYDQPAAGPAAKPDALHEAAVDIAAA